MKNYIFILFLISFFFFVVKLIILAPQQLFFDESATWIISRFTSIGNILIGNHNLGDLPVFLIISKPLTELATSEIQLRLLPLAISLAFIILYRVISELSFNKEIYKTTVAILLLNISPVFLYYSIEYKSYLLGAFLQLLSVLLFFKITYQDKTNLYLPFIGTALLGIFNSFSSVFVFLFFFFELATRWKKIKLNSINHKLFFSLVTILSIFGLWMFMYNKTEYSIIARSNYVGNVSDFKSVFQNFFTALGDWFDFFPSWIGNDKVHIFDNYQYIFDNISFLSGLLFILILLTLTITNTKTSILSGTLSDSDIFSNYLGKSFIFMFGGVFIFSFIQLNVFPIRLHLLTALLVPLFLTKYFVSNIRTSPLFIIKWLFVFIFFLLMIRSDLKLFGIQRTNVKYATEQLSKRSDNFRCFFFSHSFAEASYVFYSMPHSNEQSNQKRFLINYNLPESYLLPIESELNSIISFFKTNYCEEIVLYSYFDFWDESHSSYLQFEQLLNSYHIVNEFEDGWQFKTAIYALNK